MIDSENFYLVQQIASLLEKKLDLKVKDHGMWRIQCLIWDTLCLLYTSPSPRDATLSRMPSSA